MFADDTLPSGPNSAVNSVRLGRLFFHLRPVGKGENFKVLVLDKPGEFWYNMRGYKTNVYVMVLTPKVRGK